MASRITSFLEKLGLTEYEAKTLDALFKLNEAQAPSISRQAQVPKTRVYDVLDRLVKKNLIIEVYGRPKKYRVIEAEKAFAALIAEKSQELADLEKQSLTLLKDLKPAAENLAEERVLKVKTENDFIKILSHEIEKARKSVMAFTRLKAHPNLKTALKSAAQKKVEVRLMHRSFDEKTLTELQDLGATLKSADKGLNAFIIDGRKVVLALNDFGKSIPEYHFTIYNDKKEIVELLKHYFDKCWLDAE